MNVSHIILMHLYKFILIKYRYYWYMIGIWNTKILYQNLINFHYPFINNIRIALQDFYLFCVGLRTSTEAIVDGAYLSTVYVLSLVLFCFFLIIFFYLIVFYSVFKLCHLVHLVMYILLVTHAFNNLNVYRLQRDNTYINMYNIHQFKCEQTTKRKYMYSNCPFLFLFLKNCGTRL